LQYNRQNTNTRKKEHKIQDTMMKIVTYMTLPSCGRAAYRIML